MIGAHASQAANCAKEQDNKGEKRLTTYQLKQWRTFKVQGVKRKRSVIGAHKRCWKYFLGSISKHGEAKRDVELIGEDENRQLESSWRKTRI
jgi:hypothetical protein